MSASVTTWDEWDAAARYAETIARLDREEAAVEAASVDALVPVVCLRCGRTLGYVRLAAGSRADFCCACGRIEMVEGPPAR